MNIIEKLGGYDKAKDIANCKSGVVHPTQQLLDALIEYRRENNIFETGDKYVMLKIVHNEILTVLESEIDEPWFNTRIIRHATPLEIKAGHRL